MQQTNENWHCLLSHLGHFHPWVDSPMSRCLIWRLLATGKFLTPPPIRCTSLYRLVRDRYSTFLLLSVSSPWLLLAVPLTRHFPLLAITQRFLYSIKDTTCIFTQTFHYQTFQLLDVSELPTRRNFVQWCTFVLPIHSASKKLNLWKSKLTNGSRFENQKS